MLKIHSITRRRHPSGFVSLLSVFTIAVFMLALMLFSYERAIDAQAIQADVQIRTDYREKEESILRSIVALTPNRAIRAMQDGSNSSEENRNPLKFEEIFREAITQSNASQSISPALLASLNIPVSYSGNSSDSSLVNIDRIFHPIIESNTFVTGGLNRDLAGFPPALITSGIVNNDDVYPIITNRKVYGALSEGSVGLSTALYPVFNRIPYPKINFGYATPGQPFLAKRNWWAFTMDLAGQDAGTTRIAQFERQFVLSIYEIPSQLPISSSAYMALGTNSNGQAWGADVNISGNIFAGRATVEGTTPFDGLATRRGAVLAEDSTIGGQSFTGNPFAPGTREDFRPTTADDYFPISLASESGKAAFVSINRGKEFFDRYPLVNEAATISPTTWNDYSVGARQCVMHLDITQCAANRRPTVLKFSYLRNGIRSEMDISEDVGPEPGLTAGYIRSVGEGQTAFFATPVDLAYGINGNFKFKEKVQGSVDFNDFNFEGGDPAEPAEQGWYRPLYPFAFKQIPATGQHCVAFYPERLEAFLTLLGANGCDVNNSISINVDHPGNINIVDPANPPIGEVYDDYGVILKECGDLSDFTSGFSLVTNLRLYIGDDFNTTQIAPPAGYTPPSGTFYPPSSLFAPDKRYGVEADPTSVNFSGQVGSTASESSDTPFRPLDATSVSENDLAMGQISVNLSQITQPAELPPIFMMNWLILIEEKRKEFSN